jgi:hypothetical protein
MATQAKTKSTTTTGPSPQGLVDRAIEAGRGAGHGYLDAAQWVGDQVAELQKSIGEASQVELVSEAARTQADVTREIVDAYVSAGRRMIG